MLCSLRFSRIGTVPGLILLWGWGVFAKAETKVLDFAAVKHYQVALENNLQAIFREDALLLTAPERGKFFLKSAYDENAKEQDLGFGSLKSPLDGSERIDIPGEERRIRGIWGDSERWYFLDSEKLQLLVFEKQGSRWLRPADIIFDTLRPPRDAKGEATRKEVDALRSGIRKALSNAKTDRELLGGITAIPSQWKDSDGSQFLVWLRLPEAPLLTMRCKDYKVCVVERSCFVKDLSAQEIGELRGMAVDPKTGHILLIHPERRAIVRLEGKGCYAQRAKTLRMLPKNLPAGSALMVDKARNLWLSHAISEDATSASAFTWPEAAWVP